MTLTEFLAARIDEDEAFWRAAQEGGVTFIAPHVAPTIAPEGFVRQMLAQAAAIRAAIALHGKDVAVCLDGYHEGATHEEAARTIDEEIQGGACPTLRALAKPYANHPAYRNEWA